MCFTADIVKEGGSLKLRVPVARNVPGTDDWPSEHEAFLPTQNFVVHRIVPPAELDADTHQRMVVIKALLHKEHEKEKRKNEPKKKKDKKAKDDSSNSSSFSFSSSDSDGSDSCDGSDSSDSDSSTSSGSGASSSSKKDKAKREKRKSAGKKTFKKSLKQIEDMSSSVSENVIADPKSWYDLSTSQRNDVCANLKMIDVGPQQRNASLKEEDIAVLRLLIMVMRPKLQKLTRRVHEAAKIVLGRLYQNHAVAIGHDYDEVKALSRRVLFGNKKVTAFLETPLKKRNNGRAAQGKKKNNQKGKKNNNKAKGDKSKASDESE